jgi:phosphate transport system substrate-binding protein
MRIKTFAISLAAFAALAIPASAGATTLIGSGSIAAQPVLQALFAKYTQLHPSIHFQYTANGGNSGVKDVQQGRSMFAGQARLPLPSDAGTTYIKLYLDGLCMDVNKNNNLGNITIDKTRDIYTGVATNWNQVPGSNLANTIDPVGRDTNGGTYNFFLQAVLNNQLPSSNVNAVFSDGLVVNAVKKDDNAIGYAGLAWQGSPKMHAVKVNGVPCHAKNVKTLATGKGAPLYPLSRYIFLVVPTDSPNQAVLKFANWARLSRVAGPVISKAGGVPAFNKPPKKHRKHHN